MHIGGSGCDPRHAELSQADAARRRSERPGACARQRAQGDYHAFSAAWRTVGAALGEAEVAADRYAIFGQARTQAPQEAARGGAPSGAARAVGWPNRDHRLRHIPSAAARLALAGGLASGRGSCRAGPPGVVCANRVARGRVVLGGVACLCDFCVPVAWIYLRRVCSEM